MLIPILLSIISAVVGAERCPVKYSRFSAHHSFCAEPNEYCQIVFRDVTNEDRKLILKVHNDYRSKVATGQEHGAGGLPTASNMMEMDWDAELESVAQKWATQCMFEHDCNECRYVENFSVGQNLAYEEAADCSDKACLDEATKPNWEGMIKLFYDEVKFFKKHLVKSYQMDDSYGHFSQVVWANTWKVGCGYVVYKNGNRLRKLYVCNYGPAGNGRNEKMYKAGKPCSQCPSNSCCGNCRTPSYPGLCKLENSQQGLIFESSNENLLLNCNWKNGEPTCDFKVDGNQNWSLKPALGGNYYTILLKGGEKTSFKPVTAIVPKSESFCLVVSFRKSPTDASRRDSSSLSLDLIMSDWSSEMPLQSRSKEFVTFPIDLGWGDETEVVLNFSVPPNSPDHILDVKEISAYDGNCKK